MLRVEAIKVAHTHVLHQFEGRVMSTLEHRVTQEVGGVLREEPTEEEQLRAGWDLQLASNRLKKLQNSSESEA